jgi:hypothetical protein
MIKYQKWIFFALAALVAILSQFYIQQRYTTLLQGGTEYQWPVKVNRHIGWVPSDYLEVEFLGSYANWEGSTMPEVGQEVYVVVSPKTTGVLQVTSATDTKPTDDEYIRVNVKKFDHGVVEFSIPFNRVKVDLSKVDSKFYTNYRGTLIGTLKLRDGYGVVTGVYAKGVPLELATPESVVDQEKDSRILLEKIGDTEQEKDDIIVIPNSN